MKRVIAVVVIAAGFVGCGGNASLQKSLDQAKANLEKVQAVAVGPCGQDAAAALLAIGKAGASCSAEIQAAK